MRQAELKFSEISAVVDLGPCEAGDPCRDPMPGEVQQPNICRIHKIRWLLDEILEAGRDPGYVKNDILRRAHAFDRMRQTGLTRADPSALLRRVGA